MTNYYINEQTAGGHSLTFDDDGNLLVDDNPVGGGGGTSLTVNNGPVVNSGVLPLQIPKQPIVPLSGIIQSLPPLIGRTFPGTFVSYAIDGAGADMYAICAGPDGNLWVTDYDNGQVWRVTTAGEGTAFALAGSSPGGVCAGPDGNLWVTDEPQGSVWRVTPDGTPTQFLVGQVNMGQGHICAGPDGNLWVSATGGPWVIAADGTGSQITLEEFSNTGICAGPDGNIWACDAAGIRQFVPGGPNTFFPIEGANPLDICAGPDGNLWVADTNGLVWRVTTAGALTSFSVGGFVDRICAGAGGDLWATNNSETLIKVTVGGEVSTFSSESFLGWLCSGPDGSLWFSTSGGVVTSPFTVQMGGLNLTTGPLTVGGQPASTGPNSIVSGSDGVALGDSGLAYSPDQTVIASTNAISAGVGTAQRSVIVAVAQTVDSSDNSFQTCMGPVILNLVDQNQDPTYIRTIRVHADVVSRRTDTPGTDSAWQADGVIRGDGSGAYTWVGGEPPTFTVIAQDADAASWLPSLSVTANVLQGLAQGGTGEQRWEMTLTLDEVAG